MKQNVVYILRCQNNAYYTGWTNDFLKRMNAHKNKTGAKYTRCFPPVEVVYVEVFETKQEAMKKEALIKKMNRAEKTNLIESHSLDDSFLFLFD